MRKKRSVAKFAIFCEILRTKIENFQKISQTQMFGSKGLFLVDHGPKILKIRLKTDPQLSAPGAVQNAVLTRFKRGFSKHMANRAEVS